MMKSFWSSTRKLQWDFISSYIAITQSSVSTTFPLFPHLKSKTTLKRLLYTPPQHQQTVDVAHHYLSRDTAKWRDPIGCHISLGKRCWANLKLVDYRCLGWHSVRLGVYLLMAWGILAYGNTSTCKLSHLCSISHVAAYMDVGFMYANYLTQRLFSQQVYSLRKGTPGNMVHF